MTIDWSLTKHVRCDLTEEMHFEFSLLIYFFEIIRFFLNLFRVALHPKIYYIEKL